MAAGYFSSRSKRAKCASGIYQALYRRYDERNVVSAPSLAARNRRLEWSPDSPAFRAEARPEPDYEFRQAR